MKVVLFFLSIIFLIGCTNLTERSNNENYRINTIKNLNKKNIEYLKRESTVAIYSRDYNDLYEIDSIVNLLLRNREESSLQLRRSLRNSILSSLSYSRSYIMNSEIVRQMIKDSLRFINDYSEYDILMAEYIIGNEIIQSYNSGRLGIPFYKSKVDINYLNGEKIVDFTLKMIQTPKQFFAIINNDTIYCQKGGLIKFKLKDLDGDSIVPFYLYNAKYDKYYDYQLNLNEKIEW